MNFLKTLRVLKSGSIKWKNNTVDGNREPRTSGQLVTLIDLKADRRIIETDTVASTSRISYIRQLANVIIYSSIPLMSIGCNKIKMLRIINGKNRAISSQTSWRQKSKGEQLLAALQSTSSYWWDSRLRHRSHSAHVRVYLSRNSIIYIISIPWSAREKNVWPQVFSYSTINAMWVTVQPILVERYGKNGQVRINELNWKTVYNQITKKLNL